MIQTWNCLFGNTINLLDYLGHLDESRSRGINEVILHAQWLWSGMYCRNMDTVYWVSLVFWCSQNWKFFECLSLPMLINVKLKGIQVEHVVGIAPYKSSMNVKIHYHLIDVAHPKRKPMEFTSQNLDWCFDEFKKIHSGFCFFSIGACSINIAKSIGFEIHEGRPVYFSMLIIFQKLSSCKMWWQHTNQVTLHVSRHLSQNFGKEH